MSILIGLISIVVLFLLGALNSLAAPFIYALFGIAVGAIMAVLGLFSSIHFIKSQLLANNQGVSEKLDGLISKVQSHQVTLGLVGMGLSVLFLLMTIA